jgi:hypothetical protein
MAERFPGKADLFDAKRSFATAAAGDWFEPSRAGDLNGARTGA